jgi:hypothetical protein
MFLERMNDLPKLQRSEISEVSPIQGLSKRRAGFFYKPVAPPALTDPTSRAVFVHSLPAACIRLSKRNPHTCPLVLMTPDHTPSKTVIAIHISTADLMIESGLYF